MFNEDNIENCIPCTCAFEWHKRFSERRQNVEDDECPRWSSTLRI